MSRLSRRLHRLHRALGSALCALLFVWFASGAVMTVAGFPRYTERERLRDAEPLPADLALEWPAEVQRFVARGELAGGALRLVNSEGVPRWLVREGSGRRSVYRAAAPFSIAAVSAPRAKALAERVTGFSARSVERLEAADQWTVPLPSAYFPLWRVALDDPDASELYLAASSGEIVQRTQRGERLLAWLGAIPHWIYPTLLRRERVLWKRSVITLACAALLLTACGMWIGVETQRKLRRRRGLIVRDASLRWHQRLGLGFGVLVASWLGSGILSFTPFDWTDSGGAELEAQAQLVGVFAPAALANVAAALAACQTELSVRELSLHSLAGVPLAVCADADGGTRVVRLHAAHAVPTRELDPTLRVAIADALRTGAVELVVRRLDRPDDYYYPTHASPELALPVLRIERSDAARSTLYIDLRRAELVAFHTERTRLERWLFHGLHSWDLPALYRVTWLWRSLLWLAMALGSALSLLGASMALRRVRRRRLAARRHRAEEA
jgi:hypothetical protein